MKIYNCPLQGIGVRDFYRNSIGDLLCYACFWQFLIFLLFSDICFFSYKKKIVKFVRRCFGRLDGSIRALRKVRIRNETDNFIESISQMVPRWSPEVPDGPQRSPKPITSCGRPPKPITSHYIENVVDLVCPVMRIQIEHECHIWLFFAYLHTDLGRSK